MCVCVFGVTCSKKVRVYGKSIRNTEAKYSQS